ncbi:SDR family NAD(P)-dependent oxidoreductase [Streptomyces sp. NPDC047072]|uniref:SDR family NAD(P)-dependent oxidoreductase n=1 Tax=Streptomyces sp. NPDC047072 TaxID=3154809 RepID=UPI0033F8828B
MTVNDPEIVEALRDSLRESERLRQENVRLRTADREPIAIVGLACRYPGGVRSPEDLWRVVADGVDATSEFPVDRGWPEDLYDPDPDAPGRSYVRRGGFLDDVAGFDAEFFGISPREVLAMDPQQRLLLEVCWETLERAGIDPRRLRGSRTGVFVGASSSLYAGGPERAPSSVQGYALTGSLASVLSGRASYTLGLEGPALTVDTACSSSLVALHLASRALRGGDCSLALAAGVTVVATPTAFVEFSRQRGLAADGRCRPFGAGADGFGVAEGVGVLLLERLSDARRHGHRVWALVRGSAVNQDGASNGLTAPNGPSQERVIRQALDAAGASAAQVDVVEAHGTGTKLGDPIEAQALLAAYGRSRPADRPLWLGSVKSNLGHTQAAAGMAGVVKTVMAFQREQLPRTLHADPQSPLVDWEAGAVRLLHRPQPWPRGPRPRLAGVSSFGVSGTNAHVILEEAPAEVPTAPDTGTPEADRAARRAGDGPRVLLPGPQPVVSWPVSAATPAGLRNQAHRLIRYVEDHPDARPTDLAHALASRSALHHRAVVVGTTHADLLSGLAALVAGRQVPHVVRGVAAGRAKAALVFPGQGWQWPGMGSRLMEHSPVFATALRECSAAVEELTGWSVVDVLGEGRELARVEVVQPVMFSVMVALARTWQAMGVRPASVVGHSQGEIAAACVSGALALPDAVRIVVARATALRDISGEGAMISVPAGPDEVGSRLPAGLTVAAVNGPAATVVSGPREAAEDFLARCVEDGLRARRIPVDYASHSPHVERLRARLLRDLSAVRAGPAAVPLCSTVTGTVLEGARLDGTYWYDNLRRPVRFETATRALLDTGHTVFVEVAAHPVLAPGIEQTIDTHSADAGTVSTLRRDDDGPDRLHLAAADAWTRGLDISWPTLLPAPTTSGAALSADLPTYGFDRQRYWLAPREHADLDAVGLTDAGHGLLGAVTDVADERVVLSGRLSTRGTAWLADHTVADTPILPGSAFVELMLRAGDHVGSGRVRELLLVEPLPLPDTGADVQVVVDVPEGDERRVRVYARPHAVPGAPWTRHAEAVVVPEPDGRDSAAGGSAFAALRSGAWPPVGAEPLPVDGLYARLAERGYGYGPAFQGVRAAWRRDDEVFAEVELPEQAGGTDRFALHPALLDAAAQSALLGPFLPGGGPWLPFCWNDVSLYATGARRLRVQVTGAGPNRVRLAATDPAGAPVVLVGSLRARRARAGAPSAAPASDLLVVAWEPVPVPETAVGRSDWAVVGPCGPFGDAARSYADLDALVDEERPKGAAPAFVLLPVGGSGGSEDEELPARADRIAADTLATLQRWLADPALEDVRLVLVTQGAVAVDDGEMADLAASVVWGLVRTAQSEHPGRFVLLDLDPGSAPPPGLLSVLARGDEPQLAVRAGVVRAARLERAGGRVQGIGGLGAGVDWRVDVTGTGTLDRVDRVSVDPRPLGADEVRLAVRAAGLNFYDVATALGMVPDHAGLGAEGAGVVLETGSDVRGLRAGDRVLGMFPGAFAPRAVADPRTLAPIPDGWSFEQAASVPAVFLTAYHALVDLAGLEPRPDGASGRSVLVHAAAGGVGMAAVQLARAWGATVYATAGPGKEDAVVGFGVPRERIASSRTTAFADLFLEHTGGRGVDVVLGSLSGAAVDASLRLLPRGGCYLEMGKTDVRDAAEVAAACPGVRYRAFDLQEAGPERIGRMLTDLLELFGKGVVRPLPTRTWDLARIREALRHMSQGRHMGKNVLCVPAPPDPDGTVVVTGGTGTLGSLVARHLVRRHKVRRLLLLSRTGADAPGADALCRELADAGATATCVSCDVSDFGALAKTLADIPEEHPLTAIVHTAGALRDAPLTELTPDDLRHTFAAKVDAAVHLHRLTRDRGLTALVLFSSAGSVLGGGGQANYTAANAFLDALAVHARAQGHPVTSVAWGLWQEVSGLTTGLTDADRARMSRSAVVPMTTQRALALLDAADGAGHPLVLATDIDLTRAPGAPLWRRLTGAPLRPVAAESVDLRQRLAAQDPARRRQSLLDLVRLHTAAVLAHPGPEAVDPGRGFLDQGLDSLTAIELRNRLAAATGLRLSATTVFDHPAPDTLAAHLADRLGDDLPAGGSSPGPDVLAEIDRLQAALTAADERTRRQAMVRLRRLTASDDGALRRPSDSVQQTLASASAEELLAFIDDELG